MELNTRDSGLKTNSMDSARRPGPMVLSILVVMKWVKNMVKGYLCGIPDLLIL